MTCCPTCGGPLAPSVLVVDLNTNNVIYRGRRFPVDPKMAEMLFVLNEASPKHVPDDVLAQAMWGDVESEQKDVRTAASTYVCRARKFLGPFGVRFERVSHRGFRMYFHEMQEPDYAAMSENRSRRGWLKSHWLKTDDVATKRT